MKICPDCKTKYDDSVDFCMNDGTKLVEMPKHEAESAKEAHHLTDKQREELHREQLRDEGRHDEQRRHAVREHNREVEEDKKGKKTLGIVVLAILGTIVVLGIGYWLASSKNSNDEAANTQEIDTTVDLSQSTPLPTAPPMQTPVTSAPPVVEQNTVVVEPRQVQSDVAREVSDWQSAAESTDPDQYAQLYAPKVNYYSKEMSKAQIIQARQAQANKYDQMDVSISNVQVTPASDGKSATVVFDREWNYSGVDNNNTSGKAQTQLIFQNINGQWLIVSEKDLKQYPSAGQQDGSDDLGGN